ncbi:MAG: hypothetical protein ACRDTG_09525 [Pseudonocardiaceae bacterium]
MPGVFINYRFADERFGAGMLYDLLVQRFGTNQVFRDCVSLQPGHPYPAALRAELEQADVLLAVIGSSWLSLSDHTGTRLVDRPEDWVRREVARALESVLWRDSTRLAPR